MMMTTTLTLPDPKILTFTPITTDAELGQPGFSKHGSFYRLIEELQRKTCLHFNHFHFPFSFLSEDAQDLIPKVLLQTMFDYSLLIARYLPQLLIPPSCPALANSIPVAQGRLLPQLLSVAHRLPNNATHKQSCSPFTQSSAFSILPFHQMFALFANALVSRLLVF